MVAEPQSTVILCLVLGLGPRDGERGLASRQGTGESDRNPWNPVGGTTYYTLGYLVGLLLDPASVVTGGDGGPRAGAAGEYDRPPRVRDQ